MTHFMLILKINNTTEVDKVRSLHMTFFIHILKNLVVELLITY